MSNNVSNLLVTLRHNIGLESDTTLALEEISAICATPAKRFRALKSPSDLLTWLSNNSIERGEWEHRFVTRLLRREGTVAYALDRAIPEQLVAIIERSAFTQEVLLTCVPEALAQKVRPHRLIRARRRPGHSYSVVGIPIAAMLEYSASLVFQREQVGNVTAALDALGDLLLDDSPPPAYLEPLLQNAVKAKKTTLYLSHELHLYKGKFFPRLVHSLINRYAPPARNGLICDPFVGSGTALLEASLLGYESVGLDVDPTAVMVSKHKTSLASIDPDELDEVCAAMNAAIDANQPLMLFRQRTLDVSDWSQHLVEVPEPMRYRLAKRGREEGYDLLGEIEKDSAIARALISQVPTHLQSLFQVCLSHALTKKIRLRFVGIGNGRFTFDVAKSRVLDIFLQKAHHVLAVAEAFRWLKHCGIVMAKVAVHRRSALELLDVCGHSSLDLVVTSPPYIPASSGREHYSRARAIPLVVTGAATMEELEQLDAEFVGEMHNGSNAVDAGILDMPPAVERTLEFLRSDLQRERKFLPTLKYYRDIRKVLIQVRDALTNDGAALFVVAKSHTFYIHKTKQILHTVDAADAIAELGSQVGLVPVDIIEVPLAKSGGPNARPRSTDEYAEAVVVFQRNY